MRPKSVQKVKKKEPKPQSTIEVHLGSTVPTDVSGVKIYREGVDVVVGVEYGGEFTLISRRKEAVVRC